MTLITEKHSRKNPSPTVGSRTTSSDKLRKKEGKKVSDAAAVRFNTAEEQPRKSVDLGHQKAQKEYVKLPTASSNSQSHEHSEQKILPNKLPTESEPTLLQINRREEFKNYDEARKTHDKFAKKIADGKVLSESEHEEFQEASSQLHLMLYQLSFGMNILPSDGFDYFSPLCRSSEGVDFFSPELRNDHREFDFKPLNKYLNEKIVLSEDERHVQQNLQKMFRIMSVEKARRAEFTAAWEKFSPSMDPKVNKSQEYKKLFVRLQKQFASLSNYELKLRMLCDQLRNPGKNQEKRSFRSFTHGLNSLMVGKSELFVSKVVDAIELRYLQLFLKPILIRKARELIECHQHANPKAHLMYEKAINKWESEFKDGEMKDPLPDWLRAILGGIVWFVDDKNNVLLEPFNDPGEEVRDPALNQYVLACQEVVGEHLFNDGALMVKLCQLIQDEANIHRPAAPGETLLDGQQRIMAYLTSLQQNPVLIMSFFENITKQLNAWNLTRGENTNPNVNAYPVPVMLQFLMMFYRAPSQKFMWGATGVLKDSLKLIFPDATGVIGKYDGDDNITKSLHIRFMPYFLDIVWLRLSTICAEGTDATYTLTQKLTLKIPKHGGAELKQPVTSEFYYEVPEGLSREDIRLLDINKDKLDFVLSVNQFPPLQRIKSVKD
jgi:hypothetical protein